MNLYRRDIDGLRAVAVLAVLVFHAFPKYLPGGFVGVDVFFVISGFLITGIIVGDLQRGTFSYRDFYSRRVRRIFPALSLVLAATLAVGWYVLLPGEYAQLGKHTIAAALFGSNLVFWRDAGYFDAAAQSKPLLHLWSLGIEEQFYIAWPWILTIASRRARRLLSVVCCIALASFALNLAVVGKHHSAAFYLPFTRAWELMIGGAVACWNFERKGRPAGRVARDVASVLGLVMMAAALGIVTESRPFPGWWALLPSVGTGLVIAAGAEGILNRSVLSLAPAVLVGKVSYPLYLWHWPALVFFGLINESDWHLGQTGLPKFLVLAASFVLATATWRYLENSFRVRSAIPDGVKVRRLAVSLATVAVIGVFAFGGKWQPRLSNPHLLAMLPITEDEWNVHNNFQKASGFGVNVIPSRSQRETLFVGDSHMEMYWPQVNFAIQQNPGRASAVFATSGGCPPLPDLNPEAPGFHCPEFYPYWVSLAKHRATVDTVVIAAYWEAYLLRRPITLLNRNGEPVTPEEAERSWNQFAADVTDIVGLGKRVILFSSSPTSKSFDPHTGIFRRLYPADRPHTADIRKADFLGSIQPVDIKLQQLAQRSKAMLIHPTDYLCGPEICPATDPNGVPLYRDSHHLRASAVIERATFVERTLDRF
jgi:peptidoglycan/LPS O-acetylase OafA/YrhL